MKPANMEGFARVGAGFARGGAWSLEHDQAVWSALGKKPRTAAGLLSSAGGVRALVQQLAQRFGRTESAITQRIEKALDDPMHVAYARLHGLPPPVKVVNGPWSLADDQTVWSSLGTQPARAPETAPAAQGLSCANAPPPYSTDGIHPKP